MKELDLINKIIKLETKSIAHCFTPFPIKRSRDKTLNYLKRLYNHKNNFNTPFIAWGAILMNSFYTQDRIVCALTNKLLKELCEKAGKPFKDRKWKEFIRICSESGMFECIQGLKGQPWIFILTEPVVLEGFKIRSPGLDLEKLKEQQLNFTKAFIGKAKVIPTKRISRN